MEFIFLLLLVFMIWLIPTIAIWAVNVLIVATGSTAIAFSARTWFAMLVLILIFAGASSSKD